MKTITIKMPEREARELDSFIKRKNYSSKSEFIRNLIMERLERNKQEDAGWLALAEQSLAEIWDNPKDDEVWSKYL